MTAETFAARGPRPNAWGLGDTRGPRRQPSFFFPRSVRTIRQAQHAAASDLRGAELAIRHLKRRLTCSRCGDRPERRTRGDAPTDVFAFG